jgi:hypothetical protein
MTRNYTVGRGKPPRANQFKKGVSGNPKGRPKGSLNVSTDLTHELSELVTVRENGQTRRVSKKTAMIKALIAKAMGGDVRAVSTTLELAARYETDPTAHEAHQASNDEFLILNTFTQRAAERVRARTKKRKAK